MKLAEAQNLSVSGVAVFGNPVMQDIIWAKDSPYPFLFVGNGYRPMDLTQSGWMGLRDRDGWQPLHRLYRENSDSSSNPATQS